MSAIRPGECAWVEAWSSEMQRGEKGSHIHTRRCPHGRVHHGGYGLVGVENARGCCRAALRDVFLCWNLFLQCAKSKLKLPAVTFEGFVDLRISFARLDTYTIEDGLAADKSHTFRHLTL